MFIIENRHAYLRNPQGMLVYKIVLCVFSRNLYEYISDAPIMIFRGRFRYRFFSSKLADSDSDTDFFSFKQPTRNNERF